jgi:hypothetical protein
LAIAISQIESIDSSAFVRSLLLLCDGVVQKFARKFRQGMAQSGIVRISRCFFLASSCRRRGSLEGPIAVTFGGDGPKAEQQRSETENHEAPNHEHLGVSMLGSGQKPGAMAGWHDGTSLGGLGHPRVFRKRLPQDGIAVPRNKFGHLGSTGLRHTFAAS